MDLQDKLYYGIKDIFEFWTAMKLAKEGEWAGPDTMEKVEWFNETLADYMFDEGEKIDVLDIEEVLDQVLLDEFSIQLEDGSSPQVARKIYNLYQELVKSETTQHMTRDQ